MIIVGFVQQLLELVIRELAARLQFEGSFELFIRYRAAPILVVQVEKLCEFVVGVGEIGPEVLERAIQQVIVSAIWNRRVLLGQLLGFALRVALIGRIQS